MGYIPPRPPWSDPDNPVNRRAERLGDILTASGAIIAFGIWVLFAITLMGWTW